MENQESANVASPRRGDREDPMSDKFCGAWGRVLNWVVQQPRTPNFAARWQAVNNYLIQIQAPHLTQLLQAAPIIDGIETEFLAFAISSILWKTLCYPIFVGVSTHKRDELTRLMRAVLNIDSARSIVSNWPHCLTYIASY